MDEDVLNEAPVHYSQDRPPSYYPAHGIWFNDEDVSIKQPISAEDEEELEKLAQEEKAKQ